MKTGYGQAVALSAHIVLAMSGRPSTRIAP